MRRIVTANLSRTMTARCYGKIISDRERPSPPNCRAGASPAGHDGKRNAWPETRSLFWNSGLNNLVLTRRKTCASGSTRHSRVAELRSKIQIGIVKADGNETRG